jgi:hypothetical protein
MLRSLDIQPPLDITELSRRLGEARGRPIRLIEMSLTGSLGYSLPHGPYDVCVYEKNTSEPHQNHIICHELGHIMFRHLDPGLSLYWADDCGGPGEAADLEKINRNIPFDGFPRRLRRICFDSPHERAVELIADTLMEWAVVPGCVPRPLSAELGEARTMYGSLSSQRGWL